MIESSHVTEAYSSKCIQINGNINAKEKTKWERGEGGGRRIGSNKMGPKLPMIEKATALQINAMCAFISNG